MAILTKKTRKHASDWDWRGVKDKNSALYDLRRSIARGIEDLTFLAKTLPEDQLTQVFNVLKLQDFVEALLSQGKGQRPLTDAEGIDRQSRIAALFMWRGMEFLLDRVPQMYFEERMTQAIRLRRILTYEALGTDHFLNPKAR